MRTSWVLILTAISCGASWAGSPTNIRRAPIIPAGKVLTLVDAVNMALVNQPTIRQAIAAVEAERGVVMQQRSNLLPNTVISSNTNLVGSQGNNFNSTSANITENQLVYDFGRSRWLLRQAQQQDSASMSALNAATSDVVFSVKTAYYTALRTARLVQVFEENVKAQDEHVAQAQARLDVGLAPKSDVLKAAAAAASARVDLVTARNNANQAVVDLDIAVGADVRSDTKIAETAEPERPVPGLNEAVELAMRNRPEVREADANVLAALAAVKSAETGNRPALNTAVGLAEQFGGGFGSPSSFAWLMNLQWTPFDSGLTRGHVIQTRAQMTEAQETLYTTGQTVSRDVVAARLNLLAAQESLTASRAEVASAKEDVDASTGRYQAGIGILLDVLDAQAILLKAQVDEAVALYGLSTARAQLDHAIGIGSCGGTT